MTAFVFKANIPVATILKIINALVYLRTIVALMLIQSIFDCSNSVSLLTAENKEKNSDLDLR